MSRTHRPLRNFIAGGSRPRPELREAMIGAFERFHARRQAQRRQTERVLAASTTLLLVVAAVAAWKQGRRPIDRGANAVESLATAASSMMIVTDRSAKAVIPKVIDYRMVTNTGTSPLQQVSNAAGRSGIDFQYVTDSSPAALASGLSCSVEFIPDQQRFLRDLAANDPSISYIQFGHALVVTFADGRSVVSLPLLQGAGT